MSLKALQECGRGPWGATALESASWSFSCGSFPSPLAHRACPPVSPICDPGPVPAPHGLPFALTQGSRHPPDSAREGRGQLDCAQVQPGSGLGSAGMGSSRPRGWVWSGRICISFACVSSHSSPRTLQSTPHPPPPPWTSARPGWPWRGEEGQAGAKCLMEPGGVTAHYSTSSPPPPPGSPGCTVSGPL